MDVGDGVLDDDLARLLGRVHLRICLLLATCGSDPLPLFPGKHLRRKFPFGELVAPIAKRPLGKLHDVALVHDRHALALIDDGVLDRGAEQPIGAFFGRGLQADARTLRETDFGELFREILLEQIEKFLALRANPLRTRFPHKCHSVFSRKMTMSTFSGALTGEGTPLNQRTGLKHTYRSNNWRRATLSERIPPPTGVVSGPLIEIK